MSNPVNYLSKMFRLFLHLINPNGQKLTPRALLRDTICNFSVPSVSKANGVQLLRQFKFVRFTKYQIFFLKLDLSFLQMAQHFGELFAAIREFVKFDADNSGAITRSEFAEELNHRGIEETLANQMFDVLAKHSDDKIRFEI
jgi:hypothetical protein